MKDIVGWEGLYAITSCGRVWSYRKQKFLTPFIDGSGYYNASLYNKGIRKAYKIHRLVAEAFIPNPNNLTDVNHKDEDKTHNHINNLEWLSHKDNVNYGTNIERMKANMPHTVNVLCVETGIEYPSIRDAARQTGLYASNISACINGRAQTTGGLHWVRGEITNTNQ